MNKIRIKKKNLVLAMLRADINGKTLAEKAHISAGTLSGIMNGRSCTRETAEKISSALEAELSDLTKEA